MEAIRQTVKVKNHTISIILPDNFNADEVDVIILPSEKKEYSIPQCQIDQVRERTANYLKNPESATNSDEEMKEFNTDFVLTEQQKKILDDRAKEDRSTFITSEESLLQIKKRYGL